MKLSEGKTVLLFYKEYESDTLIPFDRYLKRALRPIYYLFTHRQKTNGYRVWRDLLIKALEQQGYDVHLNDYALARNYPRYPVGLIGYPVLLEDWSLPNPAVLGPGLYEHPLAAPDLMKDPRFKSYLVTCQWMEDMFKPYYGSQCVQWFAGMDTTAWPDTSQNKKEIDVLIYDKIRWDRDRLVPTLLEPILAHLEGCGLRTATIRYGQYDRDAYKALLSASKMMIFLCEHETQGMAYQEALTSNVPVLAWDNGFWLDPQREKFEPDPVPASSVPYFSEECGRTFKDIQSFYPAFEEFLQHQAEYRPRRFVEQHLTFAASAQAYMQYYNQAAADA